MKYKHSLAVGVALAAFLVPATSTAVNNTQHVEAARTDMVDNSDHNGIMTVANYTDMRNNYGVKAMTTKICEGTYYNDYTARPNIANAQAAGLYVNGYFFCWYTNVAQAVAEARYAVNLARQEVYSFLFVYTYYIIRKVDNNMISLISLIISIIVLLISVINFVKTLKDRKNGN